MKRNIRSLTAGCVLLLGPIAHGQNHRFYFGYGDAQTAALNGKSVGDEIRADRALRIKAGQNFKVQVWVQQLAGNEYTFCIGASAHIAYDRGVSTYFGSSDPAALMHRKLGFGGATMASSITNMASFPNWLGPNVPLDQDNNGIQDVTSLAIVAANLQGEYTGGSTPSERRMGLGGQFVLPGLGSQLPYFALGGIGSRTRLFDFELMNSLPAYEIYGDDPLETGLSLTPKAFVGQQAGSQSYIDLQDWHQVTLGSQLIVLAVPEPSGVLALLPGALLLLRRKK